jgi:phytoene dehydrogenase-like protein
MRAIIIGAGVNELVAAHCLARARHRVLVLDNRAARDDSALESGWIPPRVIRDLDLERHGLEVTRPDPWIATPLPAGGRLELWRDMVRSIEAIGRVSPRDAAKWPAFCERMGRLARLLERVYAAPPPHPVGRGAGDIARLVGLGLRVRRLGREGIEDLLRYLPMPVADLLDEWFENDALKAILGTAGVMGLQQGPRSGGTTFGLLHHHVGCPAGVFRPPQSNLGRVLAQRPGIEIRRGANVARIAVREGRASHVTLAGGEEVPASLIVCGADPRRTLVEWVDAGWLDPEFVRAARHIRSRGAVARVTVTLAQAPGFSTFVVAPSLDYLERAYDDAKYGRVSQAPYLEARHEGAAADGRHRLVVHMQYAPYALADGGWTEARRAALGDLALDALLTHLPDLDRVVVERSVLSPRDLEEHYGFPEGQAYHAELTLDQALWMRPLPGWARYRTPIAGLYLCGPGTHPGGGVAGAAGANAAREIIADLRRGKFKQQST